jgi:hypothetical protein
VKIKRKAMNRKCEEETLTSEMEKCRKKHGNNLK